MSILALVITVCLSFSMNVASGWAAETADSLYSENKTLVHSIDKGDYFTELYSLSEQDSSYTAAMQSAVNVAKAYAELEQAYTVEDYEQADYDKILKVLEQTRVYISLTEENYFNYQSLEAKYLERVSKEANFLQENYQTRIEKLDEYLLAAIDAVKNKKSTLIAVNTANPNGAPNKNVGYYDEEAMAELEAAYQNALNSFEAIVLDKADMAGTKAKIDQAKQKAFADMESVRKNDVERAYDKLQDYYATVDGNLEGDKEAAKLQAAEAINKCYPSFFDTASSDVMKEYSSEKKAFEDFFDENPIDDSKFKNKSVLETEDKKVKLEAFADGKAIEIFPRDAKLNVYNIVESSPKRYNAQREILKNNNQISIAYFIDVLVYYDSALWSAPTRFEGKQVVYRVTIDLNGYYDNYIKNNESFLASILKNIGLGGSATQNKSDLIESVAKEYKNDLCYIYYKDGEDGVVKSLDYSLSGGMLMFETNMLGSVAINGNEQPSLLTNPIFWVGLILALVLVIVAIVLVFKFIKYSVKFYLSDGTLFAEAKARKGESFVMPEAAKKKGFVFAGWFEDAELKNRFLQTQITARKNISVYAKYVRELSEAQLTEYYNTLCAKLASNAILDSEFETEAETLSIAKVVKTSEGIKLYVDVDPESVDKAVYDVKLVKAEDLYQAPILKIIDTTEAYNQALELVDMLVEQFKLMECDPDLDAINGTDTYMLTVAKPIPEGPTDEELTNYLKELRKEALSYALTAENEKAEDGKILVKAFKAEDAVNIYLALEASEYGLQEAEGDLADGTPAMMAVTNEEEFAKAKELIQKLMAEYGLEKVVDPSELGEGSSKGFGYRIKFNG